MNQRLIVLTDISSLTPGVREPDDGQSLIRLMLYSNEIDIEGLVASSNMGHGQIARPELIEQVVLAFGQDQPSLLLHDRHFPAATQLLSTIKAGQPAAGPLTPISNSLGKGKDTPASDWICQVVARDDPRPVWVAVWGGTADLAQALWRAREDRNEKDLAQFLRKLRVHAIADQDSTASWIREHFPHLYYIYRTYGFRGMYRGGNTQLVSSDWVNQHVKNHGKLGDLYPNYDGGDIWIRQMGRVRGIKEGDTPSYLGLIQNGLNPLADPTWGDWGGRCVPAAPNRFVDAVDPLSGYDQDPAAPMATVYRWRPAFQADFQARMDWCIPGLSHANHAPRARVNGPGIWKVSPGDTLTLDAAQSMDPDGNTLAYRWMVYREASSYAGNVNIVSPESPVTEVKIASSTPTGDIHLLLAVIDDGAPPLTGYYRCIIQVEK